MNSTAGQPPPPPKPPLPNQSQFTVPTSTALSHLRASLLSPDTRNPNPNHNPCSSISASRRLNWDSSENETSIGSSNCIQVGSKPGGTPSRAPLSDIGNRIDGVSGQKVPRYGRTRASDKTKDKEKLISPLPAIYQAEKTRVKGKAAAVPIKKTKDTGDRNDGVSGPKASEYRRKNAPEKTKEKENKISLPLVRSSPEKTMVKSKPCDVSNVKIKDIGNLSDSVFGKKFPEYHQKKAPDKKKDKGKQDSLPLAPYSAEKTRVKRMSGAVTTENTKDNMITMPISCTSIGNRRNKKIENIEPISCPPLPRTRKKRTVSNEAGNVCVSQSSTDSLLNRNKKKRRTSREDDCIDALPQEFVEQQKAYFKEIDDFELVEEEASESE